MCAMGKTIGGLPGDDPHLQEISEVTVEGDLPQADDNPDPGQGLNLIGKMRATVTNLLRKGFVAGRRTADDRGDPGMTKFEAVFAREPGGLAG